MDYKQEFLSLYEHYVTREGAAELLRFLKEKSDFFTAPASSRFHLAREGGLLEHSVNVAKLMLRFENHPDYGSEPADSLVICGLLHDLCKTNYYKVSTRNVKNEQTGQWEKQPFYMVEDSFPYGHGEKSVYMIERFFRLKAPEAMAIRWHMGGFDEASRGGSFAISRAYERYPLAVKLQLCDVEASYLVEERG